VKVIKAVKRTISGGYRFNLEGKPQDKLAELGLPSKVMIPLKQGFGHEVKPLVGAGEEVKAGQIIGKDDQGVSTPVHASVNGKVEGFAKLKHPQGIINAVVIKADGTANWLPLAGHNHNWERLSQDEIEKLLYFSGVTSLDGKGVPTRLNTSPVSSRDVEELIIQGVEDTPYHLSLSVLLAGERCDHFIAGIKILRKIMPQANVHLAVNSERRQLFQELVQKKKDLQWLNLYSLPPKYPQGNEQVLARTILGDRIKNSAYYHERVVVLSIATLLGVRDAVVEGKPLIEGIVALCGAGWKENLHLKVRIGTAVEALTSIYLQQAGHYRLIPNNLLTNEAVTDLSFPLDRSVSTLAAVPENSNQRSFALLQQGKKKCSNSRAFLSAFNPFVEQSCDTNMNGEARPCILCGYCEEVCPVGIIPHLLDKYVKRSLISKELIRYGIFDCIECNLCSFVCPSRIPVARHIKLGQQKLTDYGFKKLKVREELEETSGSTLRDRKDDCK